MSHSFSGQNHSQVSATQISLAQPPAQPPSLVSTAPSAIMLLHLFLALAAAVQLAVAFPTYKIPKAMLKFALSNSDCILPEAFVIDKFQIWTPAAGNNRTDNIFFEYSDNSTSIETKCHFNETSANVGPVGLAPRYACENNIVTFIWQNEALTMIEKACPNGSM